MGEASPMQNNADQIVTSPPPPKKTQTKQTKDKAIVWVLLEKREPSLHQQNASSTF